MKKALQCRASFLTDTLKCQSRGDQRLITAAVATAAAFATTATTVTAATWARAVRAAETGLAAAFATTATAAAVAATATATTTVTAAAAFTTTAATKATATGTGRTLFHGTCFVHNNATAAQRRAVHAVDRRLSFFISAHFHKAKAFRATCVAFHHDFSAGHGTELAEGLL